MITEGHEADPAENCGEALIPPAVPGVGHVPTLMEPVAFAALERFPTTRE